MKPCSSLVILQSIQPSSHWNGNVNFGLHNYIWIWLHCICPWNQTSSSENKPTNACYCSILLFFMLFVVLYSSWIQHFTSLCWFVWHYNPAVAADSSLLSIYLSCWFRCIEQLESPCRVMFFCHRRQSDSSLKEEAPLSFLRWFGFVASLFLLIPRLNKPRLTQQFVSCVLPSKTFQECDGQVQSSRWQTQPVKEKNKGVQSFCIFVKIEMMPHRDLWYFTWASLSSQLSRLICGGCGDLEGGGFGW